MISFGITVSSGSSTITHAPSWQCVSLVLVDLKANFAARCMKAELQTVEVNISF